LFTKMLASTVQFSNNHQTPQRSAQHLLSRNQISLTPRTRFAGHSGTVTDCLRQHSHHSACSLRTQQHAEPHPDNPTRPVPDHPKTICTRHPIAQPISGASASSSTWLSSNHH
jgi:hypothetical protein